MSIWKLLLVVIAASTVLLAQKAPDAAPGEARPLYDVRGDEILVRLYYSFDSKQEAEKFVDQGAVDNRFQIPEWFTGPADTGDNPLSEYFYDKRWVVAVYEYVPLIPKGYENLFNLPADQDVLERAWRYAVYTDRNGQLRGAKEMRMDLPEYKQIPSQSKDGTFLHQRSNGTIPDKYKLIRDAAVQHESPDIVRISVQYVGSVGDYALEIKRRRELVREILIVDDKDFRLKPREGRTLAVKITPPKRQDYVLDQAEPAFDMEVDYEHSNIVVHVNQNTDRRWHDMEYEAMQGIGAEGVTKYGQMVLAMGTQGVWRSGKHIIDFVGTPAQFEQLTAKRPSELPATYEFDRVRWVRQQIKYGLEDMQALAEQGPPRDFDPKRNKDEYQTTYNWEVARWYDVPVLIASGLALSAAERKAHLQAVRQYLDANLDKKPPTGFYERPVVLNCVDVGGSYKKFIEKYKREPNFNELQVIYETFRLHEGFWVPETSIQFDGFEPAQVTRKDIPEDTRWPSRAPKQKK